MNHRWHYQIITERGMCERNAVWNKAMNFPTLLSCTLKDTAWFHHLHPTHWALCNVSSEMFAKLLIYGHFFFFFFFLLWWCSPLLFEKDLLFTVDYCRHLRGNSLILRDSQITLWKPLAFGAQVINWSWWPLQCVVDVFVAVESYGDLNRPTRSCSPIQARWFNCRTS